MSVALVREFHTIFDAPIRTQVQFPEFDVQRRLKMIKEEFDELQDALDNNDLVEIADAIGDIQYLCYGGALEFGLADALASVLPPTLVIFRESQYAFIGSNPFADDEERTKFFTSLREALTSPDAHYALTVFAEIIVASTLMAESMAIPIDAVVAAIHKSNMTKLDENGRPIHNEYGKVIKGPNYVPPTQDIRNLLGLE